MDRQPTNVGDEFHLACLDERTTWGKEASGNARYDVRRIARRSEYVAGRLGCASSLVALVINRTPTLSDDVASKVELMEPLTPELALVDPELARVARDRLPPSGETRSPAARASSSAEDVVGAKAGHSWWSEVEGFRRRENPRTASSRLAAQRRPESGKETLQLRAPIPPRRRKRIFLGAVVLALAAIAVYALAPDSIVREDAANRAPKNGLGQRRSREPTRPSAKTAAASAPSAPPHSGVLAAKAKRRPESQPPAPFSSRVFIWPAVSGATFYKVEFFRGYREVFKGLSSKARLELPSTWVYRAHRYRLVAGIYSWKVTPAFGPASRLRYGAPIIRSSWVARR